MLFNLLGICSGDLEAAKEFYEKIPSEVDVPNFDTMKNGYDLNAFLRRCVAFDFKTKHGFSINVYENYLNSFFNLSEEQAEKIKKLSKNCEIAKFILDN